MARKCYVYAGLIISPHDVYYFPFARRADFVEEIRHENIAEIDMDNYRIENGFAKINLPDKHNELADANYLVDYDDEGDFFQCYYVRKSEMLSGYAVLTLEQDWWHTYVGRASFSHIKLRRCNRNVGNGVYDGIDETFGLPNFVQLDVLGGSSDPAIIDDNNVEIVAMLEYNNYEDAIRGNVTATGLFSINLGYLKDYYVSQNSAYAKTSSIDLAIDFIGGINSIASTSSYFGISRRCKALKAWIVPSQFIVARTPDRGYPYLTVNSEGRYAKIEVMDMKALEASAFLTEMKVRNATRYSVNNQYVCGTLNRGLTLKRHTDPESEGVFILCVVSTDELKIVVWQGDTQEDITDSFSVFLTTNNAIETGMRAVANGVTAIGKTLTGTIKGISKGGALGAASAVASSIGEFIPKGSFSEALGGGDAYRNWYHDQSTALTRHTLSNPFGVTAMPSTIDEEMRASLTGVTFSIPLRPSINIFDYVINADPLDGVSAGTAFIVVDADVSGVPLLACEQIKEILAAGVHFDYVDGQ